MVGLKVTFILQARDPLASSTVVGRSELRDSGSVSDMLVIATTFALVFVMVTDFAALLVLIGWLPKAGEQGVGMSIVPCSR